MSMDYLTFYIDGAWVDPVELKTLDVINPATEKPIGRIALGAAADVENAVAAAKRAFETFSQTTPQERLALLQRIFDEYQKRYDDVGLAISQEMGAPMSLAMGDQAGSGTQQIGEVIKVLQDFDFERTIGESRLRFEPIGVCALITPWNWPINQVACKVAPAIAAGCTVVLKPSEVAPFDACILAEVMDAAGVPAGVFNLVNGDGPGVGAPLSAHPDVDMVSFTGSTRAGKLIGQAAADTVKRVSLELGGKSANIILPDADLKKAVRRGVLHCMNNTGQSCNAPTRMLVQQDQYDEALAIAKEVAESVTPGDPNDDATDIGPVANQSQFDKIQGLLHEGIEEGAEVVTGGPGKPEGLDIGYYVKPTIFGQVHNEMTIAREEIFGPVLVVIPYKDEEEAIRIANDTPYGLSNYIQSGDEERAYKLAGRLRSGMVHINGAGLDSAAPFGGYKQSGNGREWGAYGLEEFLEVKSVYG